MKKNHRKRLDDYLVNRGFFETKSRAQGAILSGKVKVNDEIITKAGTMIKPGDDINVEVKNMPYVSRGGFKLEKAAKEFNIDVKDRICLDIGASTGGFTDFMLQNGAKKVYAIDVGYGQLAWKLRNDLRVEVIERTNIKNLKSLDDFADFAAVDVSFISLTGVLQSVKSLMQADKQEIVLLVKPQFEAGRELVPKSGVVKDKNVHTEVIKKVAKFSSALGLFPVNLAYSPIKGPAGNIEYLMHLSNKCDCGKIDENKIKQVVKNAHENL